MRKILFYLLMPLCLTVLLVEAPVREIARAWRNMNIWGRYKQEFRWFLRELKKGP